MKQEAVSYEKLVEEYEASLTTVLRGFRPSLDFVDAWVPDADLVSSLLNLIDAAEIAGRKKLVIEIAQGSMGGRSVEQISSALEQGAKGSKVLVEGAGDKAVFTILVQNALDAQLDVPSIYQKAVHQFGANSKFQRALKVDEASGEVAITASEAGVTLSLAIQPKNGFIKDAVYGGDFSQEQKGALEAFCELLPKLPILEAQDHGAIRLEYILRDKTQGRPVTGIVTVANSGPLFVLAQTLVRKIYKEFQASQPSLAKGKGAVSGNFFDMPVTESWKSLSKEQKIEKARETIRQIGPSVGIMEGEYDVQNLDHEVRLFGTYPTVLSSGEKGRRMMRLEAELKEKLDPRIQLFQEEIKDLNSKRRL